MSEIIKGSYNHKFTLTPKFGNWASPNYMRSTVLFARNKSLLSKLKKKIGVGGFNRKSKKSFNKTKKNSSKRIRLRCNVM